MNGVKKYLVDLKPYSTSYVIFGEGAKGEIKGIGKLVCSGFPSHDDVLLVEGLIGNLINISQQCDQGMNVNFNKSKCIVTSSNVEVLMKGARSNNNYYLWIPQNKNSPSTCQISKKDMDDKDDESLQQADVT